MVLQSLLLSLRTEGVRATMALLRRRIHGDQDFYVFVRQLTPPAKPTALPAEVNGVTLRRLEPQDLRELHLLRHNPPDARRAQARGAAVDAFVATRQNRIVGAAWYVDAVTPEQPWYTAVAPHVRAPARFAANIYVRPGERAAAWALAKTASEVLAASGVRTNIGVVSAHNKPSILLTRMLGGRVVARLHLRHRFGCRTVAVAAIQAGAPPAI